MNEEKEKIKIDGLETIDFDNYEPYALVEVLKILFLEREKYNPETWHNRFFNGLEHIESVINTITKHNKELTEIGYLKRDLEVELLSLEKKYKKLEDKFQLINKLNQIISNELQ